MILANSFFKGSLKRNAHFWIQEATRPPGIEAESKSPSRPFLGDLPSGMLTFAVKSKLLTSNLSDFHIKNYWKTAVFQYFLAKTIKNLYVFDTDKQKNYKKL